jgi:chromosome segregation ATPase
MTKTDWKSKAVAISSNNKQFKKRIKELTKSRDQWKEKSIGHKARADKLEDDLKKLRDKLIEIIDIQ